MPMPLKVMEGFYPVFQISPQLAMYLNGLNFLNTKTFVSFRFVDIFQRYFRIWFRYPPCTDPENFRKKYLCPPKLWKADTPFLQIFAIYLNALNFYNTNTFVSFLFVDIFHRYFRIWFRYPPCTDPENFRKKYQCPPKLWKADTPFSNFTLARHVFKWIKFLEY